MTAPGPELSVIIVNWNGGDLLLSCLRALSAATEGISSELWLVDNASTDGSLQRAHAEHPRARMTENKANLGFARAVNQAMAQAGGAFVLLLNPDVEIDARALGRLLEVMRSDPRIGIVGCSSIDAGGRQVPGYEMSFPGQRAKTVSQQSGEGKDVAWVSGASMLGRREMVAEIGMLDERFFMYYEDVDWCYRARAAGWRVVTVTDAVVRHQLGGASAQVSPAVTKLRADISRLRFYRKHYPRWRSRVLGLRMLAPLLPRTIARLAHVSVVSRRRSPGGRARTDSDAADEK